MKAPLRVFLPAVGLLAACATPAPPPAPAPPAPAATPEPPPPPPPPPPAVLEEPRRVPLKHLADRTIKPQPTRPLNARIACSFRDDTGYRGRLHLAVREAAVSRFEARVDVPRHGSCRFALKDFQQIDRLPNVVLAAKKTDCKVSLWEQGEQLTVAFRDCRVECSGSSADYLWPILVNNRKGSCS